LEEAKRGRFAYLVRFKTSATRNAWAAIVNAGFTAVEDGKNELSTT
jgi:hypothetical protein